MNAYRFGTPKNIYASDPQLTLTRPNSLCGKVIVSACRDFINSPKRGLNSLQKYAAHFCAYYF